MENTWIERNAESCARNYRFPSMLITQAEGIHLKDIQGRSYLDFTSGGQTANLGHCPPEVMSAVMTQLEHTGLTSLGWVMNEQRVVLAETLKRIAPKELSSGMVGFCNTGSQATELSLRLARQYSGRPMAVCTFGCFHGQTSMGALALNTSPDGRKYGVPQVPGILYVPYPYCFRCPFSREAESCRLECLEFIRYQLETEVIPPDETAVFFIEPVQVHGGVVPLPEGYMKGLRRLCDEYGILIAVDEVVTGMGRTGKWFGVQNWEVEVDLLYMAKPLASGLSLGAVIGRKDIMTHFRGGGTFSGNPVACAAALATISLIEEKSLLEQCARTGKYLRRRLHDILGEHPLVGQIRGCGLLLGIELVKETNTNEPAPEETAAIIEASAKNGLLMFPGGVYHNTLRLCPPLITTEADIDKATDILEKIFNPIS